MTRFSSGIHAVTRIAFALALVIPALTQPAHAQVTLNFANVDIGQVAKAIGSATDTTIIVDPRVKGQLNLVSDNPVSKERALKTMEAALRMQGFALLTDNGILKVVPEADAKLQGVPTYVGNTPKAHGDTVITQVFRLRHESATNLLPVLRPLITPNNVIAAYANDNTLVVTDYADNVRRVASIIAGIDSGESQKVDVVPLVHESALDLAPIVQRMLDPNNIGNTDATLKVSVAADPRINALLLRAANASRLSDAKALIARLDSATRVPGNMHVVRVMNANAVDLAKVLRGMMGQSGDSGSSDKSGTQGFGQSNGNGAGGLSSSTSTGTSGVPPLPSSSGSGSSLSSGGLGGSSGGGLGGSSGGQGGQGGGLIANAHGGDDSSSGGMITADAATNSLIITAPEPVYQSVRNVIDQLDVRRAQVYIEALIVELNSNTNANLGIQWQVANNSIFAGTNLATGNGNSIINLTAAAAATGATGGLAGALASGSGIQQGLNVGWIHNIFGVQGLGALLQALSQTQDANVLSTPNLITLDNEEAKIVVGTNVPIQTGSYSNLTSGTTSNAFNTFDRVDVGLTLHIKPQITDGGILKLQLYTEDSAIVNGTTNATTNPSGPQFTKRSIQSTVLADNGEIIVLGGLMQDNYQVSNSKVPLLGDIPWLGQLFRSEQKTRNKTNLMVFLRPVIISDRNTAQAVTSNRYDYVQGVTGAYKSDNNLIKDNDDPVVPPMPIGPSQGGSPAMNLFDLDRMRRQQMAPPQSLPQTLPPSSSSAQQPNAASAMNGAVQANPVPTGPSTSSPGVQP
ncbi:Putative secretin GspD [Paraburkholderia sediminicola]|uniref:Secretin GspD n=1 Tax=Paraburkholderia sediminicola TaxID=458836 RepID=A0A6J4ZUC6_9BURK|nr:type II secretion system secretin GspD [Paraburkholderia sediminicola]CAB3643622.1 Putative secretin GspD [Paraburkholderia sediminicola]